MKIFKVYHDANLLENYPLPPTRILYSTWDKSWGRYLNEFTLMIDDLLDLEDCDYVGLEHYRRSFPDYMDINLKEGHCYVSEIYNDYINNFLDKVGASYWKEMLIDIYKKDYPEESKLLEKDNFFVIGRGMFIMTINDFLKYREFMRVGIRGMIEYDHITNPRQVEQLAEEKIDWSKAPFWLKLNPHRIMAYACEYLTDVWIRTNLDYKVMQRPSVNSQILAESNERSNIDIINKLNKVNRIRSNSDQPIVEQSNIEIIEELNRRAGIIK